MHLKNIHPRLYTFNLDSGDEIRADSADSPVCFIIADQPREADFIRERAALLLRTGCRRFRFYGAEFRAELGKDGTKDVFLLYDSLQEATDFLFRALIGEPVETLPDGVLPDEAADSRREE